MRLVSISQERVVATYPIHQILFIKWIDEVQMATLRFQGDLTLYQLTGKQFDNLMSFITHSKDNHIIL